MRRSHGARSARGRWLAPHGRHSLHRHALHLTALTAESLEPRRLLAIVNLTANEQLLLELINRTRSAPVAEAQRLGIDLNEGLAPGTISGVAKQPLAPHQTLIDAARLHSQDMLDRDYFSHTTPEGLDADARAAALGYVGSVGENIAWGGSTSPALDEVAHVLGRHDDLFLSKGHRQNMLIDFYRVVGVGVKFGTFTSEGDDYVASMVTENFSQGSSAYLTGVAFNDTVTADRFYTVGEGLAEITVTATAEGGGQFTTTTGPSGGYALSLAAGTYSELINRSPGSCPPLSQMALAPASVSLATA